jgi:hypothetical protein
MVEGRKSRKWWMGWLAAFAFWTVAMFLLAFWVVQWNGHPPGLIYVPFIAIGWIVGSVMIVRDARRDLRSKQESK